MLGFIDNLTEFGFNLCMHIAKERRVESRNKRRMSEQRKRGRPKVVDRKPSEGRPQIRARCERELFEWWNAQPDKEEIVRQAVSEERERRQAH